MSIYQIPYFIIPRNGKYNIFQGLNLSSFFNDDLFEDDFFWKDLNFKLSFLEKHISENFKQGKSWSKNLKIYGDNDVNCLKILVENNLVVSISFRIYFLENYSGFLEKIINFCDEFDFIIVDNDLNVLNNNQNFMCENIKKSKAVGRFNNFFNS